MVNEPTKQSHSNYHDDDKDEEGVVSSVPSRDASSLELQRGRTNTYIHWIHLLSRLVELQSLRSSWWVFAPMESHEGWLTVSVCSKGWKARNADAVGFSSRLRPKKKRMMPQINNRQRDGILPCLAICFHLSLSWMSQGQPQSGGHLHCKFKYYYHPERQTFSV